MAKEKKLQKKKPEEKKEKISKNKKRKKESELEEEIEEAEEETKKSQDTKANTPDRLTSFDLNLDSQFQAPSLNQVESADDLKTPVRLERQASQFVVDQEEDSELYASRQTDYAQGSQNTREYDPAKRPSPIGSDKPPMQATRIDVQETGKDFWKNQKQISTLGPDPRTIKNETPLEPDYLNPEKIDMENIGKDFDNKKEYRV
jgi:hypothetical protein